MTEDMKLTEIPRGNGKIVIQNLTKLEFIRKLFDDIQPIRDGMDLRKARKELGLTQSQLANQLGLHEVSLGRLEHSPEIRPATDLAVRWLVFQHRVSQVLA